MSKAAIMTTWDALVAIVDTDLPSGSVIYAYDSIQDRMTGNTVLINARKGKLTRAKKTLESRAAHECLEGAKCVDELRREFLILASGY